VIRAPSPSDFPGIRAVVSDAFSRTEEADLVDRLRSSGVVLLELVETERDEIIGHVAFSRLQCDRPIVCAALAPLAVRADRQGLGVGSRLTAAALDKSRGEGVDAVFVLGHRRYYPKFGFSRDAARTVSCVFSDSPAFMALALSEGALEEPLALTYPPAFGS
jgi:putative acetyltransferase